MQSVACNCLECAKKFDNNNNNDNICWNPAEETYQ